jgi:hypothetical protein
MSADHVNPNRGWLLIRDGGHFAPEEQQHLETCTQCSEWLSLFSGLARSAGFKPEFQLPFSLLAEDTHLTAGRAWSLIRDRGQLSLPETGHLYYCKICNEWLNKFVKTARSAGFDITLEIPPCDCPRDQF